MRFKLNENPSFSIILCLHYGFHAESIHFDRNMQTHTLILFDEPYFNHSWPKTNIYRRSSTNKKNANSIKKRCPGLAFLINQKMNNDWSNNQCSKKYSFIQYQQRSTVAKSQIKFGSLYLINYTELLRFFWTHISITI